MILNLFFDAGVAWNKGNTVLLNRKTLPQIGVDSNGNPIFDSANTRVLALSAGISTRVNVLGYFVLEPYLAFPFSRTDIKKPVFGLAFAPGW